MTQFSFENESKEGETLVCRLTPGGRIDVHPGSSGNEPVPVTKAAKQIIEAFNTGLGNGVLHLGAAQLLTDLHPSLSYWRDVGRVLRGVGSRYSHF